MTGEVIKSFLVGLGFGVDETSLAAFNKAIISATARVSTIGAAVVATASAAAFGIAKISGDFEEIGYQYRLIAPAISKAVVLRRELFKAYGAAGVDLQKTVVSAVKLNISLSKTKIALDALVKSVGAKFFSFLTKQSDLLRQKIYANMPRIQAVLTRFVKFIFQALNALIQLGTTVGTVLTHIFSFFERLDAITGGWSTKILAFVAAWKLLNLSFLATPLGLVIAGLSTLLLLLDDFLVFQKGGKSLFDWSKIAKGVKEFVDSFSGLGNFLPDLIAVAKAFLNGDFETALKKLRVVLADLLNPLKGIETVLKGILDITADIVNRLGRLTGLKFLNGIGTRLFGSNEDYANLTNNLGNTGRIASPSLLPSINNSSSTIKANLETNVNIQGVPNAENIGKQVVGEQQRNVFDLVRGLRGAVNPGIL